MTIGMADVHLANIPFHIRWRVCDVESLFDTAPVDLINVVDPDRHPDALVGCLALTKCPRVGPFASTSLTAFA